MAEGVSVKSEEGPHQGLEILDSEKLGKYGALYGRFLLASQAQPEEIANIIDPNRTVEFNDLTEDALQKRNYNPVFENYSFAERKEEWKGIEYPEAYSQWRTKFTGFMINIQNPHRVLALEIILSNNKEAKEFTVDDADTLFNEFCEGKSDITNFIARVTTNLASQGKINPTTLQELLPHLAWIASGLFGKETASQAVTRLIELESAIRNDFGQVVEILNSNKEKINTPTDDERKVLGLLHDSFPVPQETVPGPTQEIEPTTTVITEPEEDELLPPPVPPARPNDGDMSPPPVGKIPPEVGKSLDSVLEEQDATIEVLPLPAEKEDTFFGRRVELRINGEDSGIVWRELKLWGDIGKGEFSLETVVGIEGALSIPKGIKVSIIGPTTSGGGSIYINGGKDTKLSRDDLRAWKDRGFFIDLYTKNSSEWNLSLYPKQDGKAFFIHGKLQKKDISVAEALDLLRNSLKESETPVNAETPTNAATPGPEVPIRPTTIGASPVTGTEIPASAGENVIKLEGGEDLVKELNETLQQQSTSNITVGISPELLKKYIVSVAEGYNVQGGTIEVGKDNKITIRGLQISKMGANMTLDLVMENNPDGIAISVQNSKYNLAAKLAGARGTVEDSMKGINDTIRKKLDEQIAQGNPLWKTKKVSILGENVLIEFNKTA